MAARKSAAQRREEILALALEHFAVSGYRGASTDAIARDAGISQPYLFRLFRTKRELFIACYERASEDLRGVFERAAAAAPEGEKLEAMGKAYVEQLLPDRHRILLMMQGYAAAGSDPELRAPVRECYRTVVAAVTRASGAPPEAVWQFCATGMLLNVVAALDLAEIAGEDEWAAAWMNPAEMMQL